MSQQWGGQPPPAFQYPMQTGIPFQQPLQTQATGYPGFMQQQRPPQLGLQPQPTGFPQFQQSQATGFQQPQATGFQRPPMGQMQFQPSGAIPPVPQLPANLAGQNRYLSSSPGIPSQPMGFSGAGGGSNFLNAPPAASPLVPQMTGYMDPRLAMMGTTLMPGASGAFPAGAGGSGPQFGGASLQQSIAEHNESQRGSSTVPIPWALSKQERKQYDQIFRAWDSSASGFLDGKKALEVFGASGLDQNDLAKIWMLADSSDRGKLNREEFHVAMGLIYRGLNGNTIPDILPPELVPPSEKNLDESVDILRDILKNETYNRATNGGEVSQSKRKDRSLYGNDTQDPRKDGTVYKHPDEEDVTFYRSKSRTIDRQAVRTGKESTTEDIAELQRQLENANKQLGNISAEQAKRTVEDEELDRRLDELKRRVKRVQDDISYVSQGPRSFSKDEERRKLERELLNLLHEDLPEVQRKIEERERRRKKEKDEWAIERNRRNYTSGRYGGRDDDYGREDYDRHERDRERREDRGYLRGTYDRDDRDRDWDRDRDDRDRYGSRRDYDRNRDRERYERDRPRSPPRDRTPPPPPPVPAATESRAPPLAPSPTPAAKPALKNMTREEREAFIRSEAQKRLQVQMAKLGLVSPSSGSGSPAPLDSTVEDRLAKEKAEAEEKARQAEKEMEEREKARKARLASERGESEEKPASPATPVPASVVAPAASTPSVPTPTPAVKRGPAPPPPVSRKKPAPPPPTSRSSIRSPVPSPVPPAPIPPTPAVPAPPPQRVIDPEEEALKAREEELRKRRETQKARLLELEEEETFRAREEELRKRREAQKARLLALEKEEEEARLEQDRFEARRRVLQEQKSAITSPPPAPPTVLASPPVSAPPPPPPPPPAEVTSPSRTNPFRLGQGAAATPPAVPAAGAPNPFFRPPQPPVSPATVQKSPTPSITSLPPPQRQAEIPAPSKLSFYNKPPRADSDDESGWGEEKDEDEDSSDDDRGARQKLALHLLGTVMPPRPASAGSGAQSTPMTPPTTSVSIAPPPPPPPPPGSAIAAPIPTSAAPIPPPPAPPMPPAAPAAALAAAPASAPSGDRGALFASIIGGARLKPTKTVDRSVVQGAGAVLGGAAPPAHINTAPRPASPPAPVQSVMPAGPANGHAYKESVDWYAGLAAEVGQKPAPTLPPLGEELVVAAPVPVINVSSEDSEPVHTEDDHDPLEDVDLAMAHRVRSLYKYDGSRVEDLTFAENLVLLAHPSKSGGPWWYGTISGSGAKGFFPSSYVQILDDIKAAAMYPYVAGNPDELSFEEGDVLAIVDRSEHDWWKVEKDGKIYVVPAAYLEVVDGLIPRALSTTPTTATQEIESEAPPFQAGREIEQDESDGEDSSEGWDDSDSDSDPSDEGITEERRQHEREQRELERIRVLEAAGLIIKQPAEGKKPPAPPIRRRSTKKGRRPPPAAPLPSLPPAASERERELPPLPPPSPRARLDDAYERYEAFKNREFTISSSTNRDSAAFTVSDASSIPPSSPRLPVTPGMGTVSLSPTSSIPPAVHESRSSGYTGLLSFLSRSKTPGEEKKTLSIASISAPVISAPITGTGTAAPPRENSPVFGSNWSSLLDKTALQEIPASERKRQEAIFELINTEGAYVRDLQLIVEVFYAKIMSLLDDKATTVIFANVEDILLTNTAFLSQLEGRQKECRLYIDNIGDLLEKHIGDMGVYMQYCVNQSNAIKILQSLREAKPDLAAKLQHLRENDASARSLDLSSYLLIPMQRLTRYPLLIRQILNYTDPSGDRDKIENSLIAAETILEAINESIRDQEGQERLAELSKELWVGQGHLDLTAPTRFMGPRRLLKEGLLVKTKSGRRLRAVLCTDILILVVEATKTMYSNPMPLSDMVIHELPGGRDDLAFQIATSYPRGGRTINLRASSARDCQQWMTAIEQARGRYVEGEKKDAAKQSRGSRGSRG